MHLNRILALLRVFLARLPEEVEAIDFLPLGPLYTGISHRHPVTLDAEMH